MDTGWVRISAAIRFALEAFWLGSVDFSAPP
jgi:hypothetical protein